MIQNLCICVQNLNISVTMVTMRRRKARQIWIASKYWFADDNDEWYLYFHLFICLCFCFIIFPVSKCVYLCSKTQSLCEYSDDEEEEGKTNINLNCYQILNRWYVCLFIKFLSLSSSLHQHHQDFNSLYLSVIPIDISSNVLVFFRILLRVCLITPSSSTTLKFFCTCLQFVFLFPVVITMNLVIWNHCVCTQFHLIFFIPFIIVTFQMCVVIVVKSS